MNILFINHVGEFSGAEKDLLNLSDALNNETPAEFDLWLACPPGKLVEEAQPYNLTHASVPNIVLVRPLNPLRLLGYLGVFLTWTRTLIKSARQNKIDVFHGNSFTATIYASLAAKIVRKPLVWHMHDILKIRQMNSKVVVWLSKLVDEIVCVSQAVQDNLIELGVDRDRTTVIYNSVYAPLPISKIPMKEGKERLGYTEETLLVGLIGQIAQWKGHHVFIEAVSKLKEAGIIKTAKFLIIGDVISTEAVEYKATIQQQAADLGLTEEVIFLGFRNDIPDVLQSLDLLVHCSVWHDPFPTVLLEGLAHHKCIIASRLGGVPEIIENRVSGRLFTPNDANELFEIFDELLRDPDERLRLSDGARIRKNEFDSYANFAKFLTIYNNLSLESD